MKKLRFDTLDKKPKVYDLPAAFLLAAAAATVLGFIDPRKNAVAVCAVMSAFYLYAIISLLRALRGQLRYNPYSYNTIIYTGFALFFSFILTTHVYLLVNLVRYPDVYRVGEVFRMLLTSARNYMLVTSPFLLVFSAALCVSNVSLIRHEGRRPVNLLGILLSLLIVGGVVFIFLFDFSFSGSETEVMIHDLIVNLFSAVYIYFECMLIGTMFADSVTARYQPDHDKDVIIILGCGLREDGTPTPLLRGRIERALTFAREQEEKTGKAPVFVTSGGQGPGEAISESESMKRYLTEQGIPEERIITEDRSADTAENMRFSKEKIGAAGIGGKIAYATTNYHVFRGGLLARRVKMRAQGMGAKTKWYFWPNAAVREFVGLLTSHKLKQGLILGSMIAAYVVMTVLAYKA